MGTQGLLGYLLCELEHTCTLFFCLKTNENTDDRFHERVKGSNIVNVLDTVPARPRVTAQYMPAANVTVSILHP